MPYKDKERKKVVEKAYREKNKDKIGSLNKKWREENREYTNIFHRENYKKIKRLKRGYILKKTYGITLKQYEDLLFSQKNKCAICGRHESEFKRSLHVDHCHETEIVRGLLCGNCNNGIGMFQHDINFLKNAIKYLGDK